MAKESIAWHEECLKSSERYLKQREEQARKLLEHVAEDRQIVERYRAQIERAKREGRDGFDAERFLPTKGGE
jgi:predicted RNase H-like nuclease (RuvC/YqgF family)